MNADDVRKMLDSVFEKLSPAKAQEIARGLVGEDRRENAQKLAGDLIESAQRNRERVKELIAREVTSQVKNMGFATRAELDAVKKRVRDLERASGTAPGKTATAPGDVAATSTKKRTAPKPTAATSSAAKKASPSARPSPT
jgi:polyhydroxyalkanoate synthesis regulator phasin